MNDQTGSSLEEHVSPFTYATTLERLLQAMAKAGLTIFAQVDHAAGAREAGMEMPPTMLLMYGNPRGGTPILLAEPRTALDLPLRVLVREQPDGQVLVSFRPAAAMLRQAGVSEALATRLEPAQRLLVEALRP